MLSRFYWVRIGSVAFTILGFADDREHVRARPVIERPSVGTIGSEPQAAGLLVGDD